VRGFSALIEKEVAAAVATARGGGIAAAAVLSFLVAAFVGIIFVLGGMMG
jgi:hypothetical protein